MARPTYVLQAGFSSSPETSIDATVWTDISSKLDVVNAPRITHGRTDEFGRVQPSTLGIILDNRDGRFTPGNTASPYYPNVKSGKRIRLGLLVPGGGKQMWPDDPSFEVGNFGWDVLGTPTAPSYVRAAYGLAQHGASIMLVTWAASNGEVQKRLWGLVSGRTYTVSIYTRVPAGHPNITVDVIGLTGFLAMSTKDAWVRVSRTFTATGSSAVFRVASASLPAAGQNVYLDAAQLEEGAAATAFEPTGAAWSWRFTGDVAEWPTKWVGGPGVYAESNCTAVDRFKRTGELGEYRTLLAEDILDDFPLAYYPLGEKAASTSAGDASPNDQPPLTVVQVGPGSGGIVQFGQTANSVPPFYDQRATGVTFAPGSATDGKMLRAYLKTPVSTAATGATVLAWAGEGSSPPATGPVAMMTARDGSYFGIGKDSIGNITALFYDATSGITGSVTTGFGLSNNIRQYGAVLRILGGGSGEILFYMNGVQVGLATGIFVNAMPAFDQVSVGGRLKQTFKGNISHVSFYDTALAVSPIFVQYKTGATGTGATTDTTTFRMTKLLQFLGLTYITRGTDPEFIGPQEIEGDPLEALRLVESTEDGILHIRGDGVPEFQLRNFRFNAAVTLSVIAERLDPGSLSFRGDDYGLVNDVTAKRPDGAEVRYVNTVSVSEHGRRKSTVDSLAVSDDALRSLAARQANGWGTQRNRVTGLKLSLLNAPESVILAALRVEMGSRVQVTALPSQAPTATVDVFVEGWTEIVGELEWSIEWNCSPAEPWSPLWQLGVPGKSELGVTTVLAY